MGDDGDIANVRAVLQSARIVGERRAVGHSRHTNGTLSGISRGEKEGTRPSYTGPVKGCPIEIRTGTKKPGRCKPSFQL
jgi:hypothetical protein